MTTESRSESGHMMFKETGSWLRRRARLSEHELRIAMALTILATLVSGYVWFIATHLEGISNF
jgi:hypothetical protein